MRFREGLRRRHIETGDFRLGWHCSFKSFETIQLSRSIDVLSKRQGVFYHMKRVVQYHLGCEPSVCDLAIEAEVEKNDAISGGDFFHSVHGKTSKPQEGGRRWSGGCAGDDL